MEVTCRTYQQRFLLRPSATFNPIFVGAVARAQRLFGVEVHLLAVLSNHYHLLVSVDSAEQLARFVGYLQSKIGREVSRLYGWRDATWGRRYRAIPVSDEEQAQVERLRYFLLQGVKEGLVASPRDWPGIHPAKIGVEGQLDGLWHDRTGAYRASQRRRFSRATDFVVPETLFLTPIPAWQHLSQAVRRAAFEELIAEVEAIGEQRYRESGRPPLGPATILRQLPASRPSTISRSPAPRFHAATKAVREAMRQAYQWFLIQYRIAAERLRAGLRARFPENCFIPSTLFLNKGRTIGPAGCGPPSG